MIRIFMTVSIGILLSCSKDPEPVDCSKSELMADLILVESASGCGVADGRIEINAKGGLGPYQYAMIDKSFQSTGDFTMLMPGIYSFQIRDKNQCEVVLSNITLMATDISFTAEIVENTKCVGGNGMITINMSGGVPPYQYKIGTQPFDVSNSFSELETGNYLVTVKDDAACITEFNITVGQGATNTSWDSEILPIIQNSCATTGCHNGVARTDLRIYANAKANATLIKTYTQNGYMPFEGTITAGEKEKIACWVDEGALNN